MKNHPPIGSNSLGCVVVSAGGLGGVLDRACSAEYGITFVLFFFCTFSANMVCCSRPTFVISIGVLHSITNLIVAICCTMGLVHFDNMEIEADKKKLFRTVLWLILSLCLFTVALSVSMVVGVVTKRYKLIAPYLWFSICGTAFYVSINLILTCWLLLHGTNIGAILLAFMRIVMVTGLQILILRPIYLLHKEWRAEAQGTSMSKQMTYPTAPPAYHSLYRNEKTPIDL